MDRDPAVEIFLPDIRLNDFVRILLRRRSEREDHLGKTGSGHPEIYRRIGRYNRRTAYLRLRIGLVKERSIHNTKKDGDTLPRPFYLVSNRLLRWEEKQRSMDCDQRLIPTHIGTRFQRIQASIQLYIFPQENPIHALFFS